MSIEDGHMLHVDAWNIDVPHFIFTPRKINMEPKIRPYWKRKNIYKPTSFGFQREVFYSWDIFTALYTLHHIHHTISR